MLKLLFEDISQHLTLTQKEKDLLTALFQVKRNGKRKYLLHQGDICTGLYFIIQGLVRTYHTDDKGADHVIHFAQEGDWIGDMGSFTCEQPASQSIVAMEDVEYVQIDKASLEKMLAYSSKLERYVRMVIQDAFIAHEKRVIHILSKTAEQRYQIFTENFPDLEQRLSLKHIASYLGITPESLSRIRRPGI